MDLVHCLSPPDPLRDEAVEDANMDDWSYDRHRDNPRLGAITVRATSPSASDWPMYWGGVWLSR